MWKESFVEILLLCLAAGQTYSENADDNVSIVSKSMQGSDASLIFNSDSVTVDPGQRLQLDCGVEGKYRNCFWAYNGEPQGMFQVLDVHEGHLPGMSKPDVTKGNECGIVINSVSEKDHGEWTCNVFVVGATKKGTKNIVVTVKPQQPIMDVNENPLVISEDEEKEVSCTVPAARPPARIRWFIGTEDVTARSNAENIPIDEKGTYRSVSTLKYKFHHSEDRKGLKCSIQHPTLQEEEYSEIPLDIRYAPYAISSTKIYGIPMENEYEIKYNFTSNPLPDLMWYIGDLQLPVPGENGRYVSGIKTLVDNIYMATLRIGDFSSDDIDVIYRLQAKNELGERNFDISLSTGPAPPDGDNAVSSDEITPYHGQYSSEDYIGSGTIVAIVVIVVFILIILFIIGVMRYRQLYCFGSKDRIKDHLKESGENLREEHSDTESSRGPHSKGKASNIFKNFTTLIKPKKGEKEPRLDKIEEGEIREEKATAEDTTEGKSYNPSEVVYAELELTRNDKSKESCNGGDTTEYAEIVGTLPDNKEKERKE